MRFGVQWHELRRCAVPVAFRESEQRRQCGSCVREWQQCAFELELEQSASVIFSAPKHIYQCNGACLVISAVKVSFETEAYAYPCESKNLVIPER